MVTQVIIVCDCCGTKFRLRWQLNEYKNPFVIRCPKCKIKIHGALEHGHDHVVYNASVTDDYDNIKYVQEVSAEFLTYKLTPASEFTDQLSPFMRSNIMNKSNVLRYLKFIEKHPNEAETIHELYVSNNYEYLKKKLNDKNNIYINALKQSNKKLKIFPEIDLYIVSHHYVMVSLLCSGVEVDANDVIDKVLQIAKRNLNQVDKFSKLMNENGYYLSLNQKFIKLVGLYNKNYLSLIAPITVKKLDDKDLMTFGLSSADYEELLNLYNNAYEFIGEFIIYVIGLNNIYERGTYNEFKSGIFDIEQKVKQEDKYNRIQSFVKEGEILSEGYCDTLNKIVRNSAAHFSVKYDTFTQIITFINENKKKTLTEKMYLFELAQEVLKIFSLAIKLWEIAYQLEKHRMLSYLSVDMMCKNVEIK